MIKIKPDIKSKKEDKRDIEMMKTEPDISKMTYEEEKAALMLGITAILQYNGYLNDLFSSCFCHKICVDQNSNTCYKCPQILR